jgi:RHS repeat-associated protein
MARGCLHPDVFRRLALTALSLSGGNINLTESYNSRLQPSSIHAVSAGETDLLDLSYDFGLGTTDNGNVNAIINQRDNGRTQYFAYDGLNRLLLANSQATSGQNCWGQAFGYDPWGNLTVINPTQCGTSPLSATVGPDNRLTAINGKTPSYDVAGNMASDDQSGGTFSHQYSWNAEGQMANATTVGVSAETYTYDGDGHRVKKQTAGRLYWYGTSGEVLAETGADGSNPTEYIFFAGRRIARRASSGNVSYYLSDMLGSSRVVADSNGNLLDDCDFLPYGSEVCAASSSGNHYLFTGKERDAETGNEYFGGRYYESNLGRFVSVDPTRLSAFIDDPQTWNRYSYAHNNPLEYVDSNGKWPTKIHNQIIDAAFPNLTATQRQILRDVSAQQDAILSGGQGNSLAFQHAMRGPGQSVEEAQADYNKFVSMNEDEATKDQINFWLAGNPGYSDKALAEFAAALHAVLDSTSPAHAGFQLWEWWNPRLVRRHTQAEKTISNQQLQNAVSAAQSAFNATFHPFIYNKFDLLQLMSQPREHVTSKICWTEENGKNVCQ